MLDLGCFRCIFPSRYFALLGGFVDLVYIQYVQLQSKSFLMLYFRLILQSVGTYAVVSNRDSSVSGRLSW